MRARSVPSPSSAPRRGAGRSDGGRSASSWSSPRLKDAADVIELLKAGINRARCRAWLATNAPALVPQFEELVTSALSERASERYVAGAEEVPERETLPARRGAHWLLFFALRAVADVRQHGADPIGGGGHGSPGLGRAAARSVPPLGRGGDGRARGRLAPRTSRRDCRCRGPARRGDKKECSSTRSVLRTPPAAREKIAAFPARSGWRTRPRSGASRRSPRRAPARRELPDGPGNRLALAALPVEAPRSPGQVGDGVLRCRWLLERMMCAPTS